jgi:thymidine kinase
MAKLYFYFSAMNAGKSTLLLQSSYNYQERGMQTVLFTSALDDRYQKNCIYSRIGLSSEAIEFNPNTSLFTSVQQILSYTPNLKCVLVDEAQFLTQQQVLQLTDVVDVLNIPVLAYGLRSDFRGQPFEGSLYLLALADELIELKTICHCGRKASMNMRVDEHFKMITQGQQIEIGGNERYVSVCRKHFKLGQAVA